MSRQSPMLEEHSVPSLPPSLHPAIPSPATAATAACTQDFSPSRPISLTFYSSSPSFFFLFCFLPAADEILAGSTVLARPTESVCLRVCVHWAGGGGAEVSRHAEEKR